MGSNDKKNNRDKALGLWILSIFRNSKELENNNISENLKDFDDDV
jgi:hypothetical protein